MLWWGETPSSARGWCRRASVLFRQMGPVVLQVCILPDLENEA